MKTIKEIEDLSYWSPLDLADYLTLWLRWQKDGLGMTPHPRVTRNVIDSTISALRAQHNEIHRLNVELAKQRINNESPLAE